MNYAVAVGIYIASYVLVTILPLLFVSGGSVIRVVIFSIPILLVAPRVSQRFTDGTPLLPQAFRNQGGFLFGAGSVMIWIGHLAFFGAIAAAIFFSAQGTAGVPVGIFAGLAAYPYLIGIVLVEVSFRGWSSKQPQQAWQSQRNSVFVIVGLIVTAHLAFAISGVVTGERTPDLLNYTEREALARGRGYAREVQRIAERFYLAENRIPCKSDRYIDVDSLLRGVNSDLSKELSIEILDCGRFVVTIRKPIDGVADGELQFVASPGDASAGSPLDWQCISAHHERIERHTNGECTYDPSLANTPLAPVVTQSTDATTVQPSDPPDESGPTMQDYLDRLAEPTLWEDCNSDVTTYRFLESSAGQTFTAVRIWRDAEEIAYRVASSSQPNRTTGEVGPVGEAIWVQLEDRFDTADFWNLQSGRNVRRPDAMYMYLDACKDGRYHALQRAPDDPELAEIIRIFTVVRK